MKKTALKGFLERFQDILNGLDEFDMDDALEELNAQFEDALFLLESAGEEGGDLVEDARGAVEEISGLLAEYRALSDARPELRQKVLELEMAVQMAGRNLA